MRDPHNLRLFLARVNSALPLPQSAASWRAGHLAGVQNSSVPVRALCWQSLRVACLRSVDTPMECHLHGAFIHSRPSSCGGSESGISPPHQYRPKLFKQIWLATGFVFLTQLGQDLLNNRESPTPALLTALRWNRAQYLVHPMDCVLVFPVVLRAQLKLDNAERVRRKPAPARPCGK